LESFVAVELLKEVSWLDDVAAAGYWRTYDGLEVDLAIERFNGAVVAFEIKAAQRLGARDLAGLRALRQRLGDAFTAGVVLHTGLRSAHPEDRIFTMPIDALWTARPDRESPISGS
jgi:predicted AAA+ superfamily ATPase